MAPRSSQGGISAAFKKLCEYIRQEKKKKGDIGGPREALNFLKETLRCHRNKSTTIEATFAKSVVAEIENGGDDLCDRLEVPVFCIVIDTILQSDYCREGERGINLLAAALHRELRGPKTARSMGKKMASIGTECMHILLTYFVDTNNHSGMRQWVGLLFLQLFQGSEGNREKFELGPEDSRRAIGKLVIEETNEHIRTICGQLLRAMLDANIPRQHLWPVDMESQLYTGFPDSSQDNRCWSQNFQNYIDSIWETIDPPDSNGQLYFAHDLELTPCHKFGRPGHNTNIVVDTEQMVFMIPAKEDFFDQILEVPLNSMKRMIIKHNDESQMRDIGKAVLHIENNKEAFCYLDSAPVVLHQIALSAQPGTIERIVHELAYICDDLVVSEENVKVQSKAENDRDAPSQASTHTGEADGAIELQAIEPPGSKRPSLNLRPIKMSKVVAETQLEQAARIPLPLSSEDTSQELQNSVQYQIDDDEGYDASPVNQTFKESGPKPSPQDNITAKTVLKKRTGPKQIKPKAKPAIRLNQGPDDRDRPRPGKSDPLSASQTQSKKPRSDEDHRDEPESQNMSATNVEAQVKHGSKPPVPSNPQAAPAKHHARETKAASTFSQPTNFDSDEITSPDANDASTPKRKLTVARPKTKADSKASAIVGTLAKEATQNRSQKLNKDLTAVAKKQPKRYSLNPKPLLSLPISTSISTVDKKKSELPGAMFDIPVEGDVQVPTSTLNKKSKTIAKAKAKNPASTSKITGKNTTKATKADAKKRHSAPAAIERTAAATRGKRAAAAKASWKMLNADGSDDEFEVQVVQRQLVKDPKSKATRSGTKGQGKETPRQKRMSNEEATSEQELEVDKDGQMFQLQQDDARSLGLINGGFNNDDDLYEASPRKPPKNFENKDIPSKNKCLQNVPKQTARNPTLDMASKLNDMLGDLDDEGMSPVQTGCGNPVPKEDAQPRPVRDTEDLQEDGFSEAGNAQSTQAIPQEIRRPESSPFVCKPELSTKRAYRESDTQPMSNPVSISSETSSDEELDDTPENSIVIRQVGKGIEAHPAKEPAGAGSRRPDSDDESRKRKAAIEMSPQSKRRRSTVEEAGNGQDSPQNSTLVTEKPKEGKASRKSKQKSPSPASRRSPRLAERAQEASDILNSVLSKKALVDDHLTRKPHVIAFSVKGARNQGASSIPKPDLHDSAKVTATQSKAAARQGHKRKRELKQPETNEVLPPSEASPLKKRQSISPPEGSLTGHIDDDNVQSFTSSPPVPLVATKASSQISRVNQNGSPIPIESGGQVDHFGKIKKKLLGDINEEKELLPKPIVEENALQPRPRSHSNIFGPKVTLASTVKAKPSSPAEVETRYVAHKKTTSGVYEELSAKKVKDVVTHEAKLVDPFIENAGRRSSGFTDRLRAETGKETQKSDRKSGLPRKAHQKRSDEGKGVVVQQDTYTDKITWPLKLSLKLKEKEKSDWASRLSKGDPHIHFEDMEKTLVNTEIQQSSDQSSPSDMTNGNSYDSNERGLPKGPLKPRVAPNEVWNMAVRPHYASLTDAVHRIANEMIIRLAKEEDLMGLLVDQYKENGAKILDHLSEKRDAEKAEILENLGRKKKEMISTYSEAKEFVDMTETELKDNSITAFDKEWRKRQEDIQRKISAGKRLSE